MSLQHAPTPRRHPHAHLIRPIVLATYFLTSGVPHLPTHLHPASVSVACALQQPSTKLQARPYSSSSPRKSSSPIILPECTEVICHISTMPQSLLIHQNPGHISWHYCGIFEDGATFRHVLIMGT
ncbi:uncharacterized protein BDW70DRAFT_145535, partial [Aspergillus foveolatus]|uniref:uncharacterized protein n=1 Tax=Aspergillus foveolatus TaxID=210207 RepID=UPI003CCD25C6